jgi:eukaryotic-like serine/threonine-protein kinase
VADWNNVERALDELLSADEEQRSSILKRIYSEDENLGNEVRGILESISDSQGWLSNPDEYLSMVADEFEQLEVNPSEDLIGKRIGAYKIEKLIGEGGMGAVYLAERADGEFRQKVALKVMLDGMHSESNLERFRQERTILAALNHPNIARLYHGGITGQNRPYLIMEYVEGLPLDRYCDQNALSVDERLKLFETVLRAVQYAHENLVIHRDLKPDNILVTNDGTVKILDFGIAKMIDLQAESSIDITKTLTVTPRYSAPEQIAEKKITTSADIYSLGVLFYRLICGNFPFSFEDKTFFEVQQTILFELPESPLKKFENSESAQKVRICEERSVGQTQIRNLLSSDLSAIALKAIEKKPRDRYRTADSFLEDIERYRQNLPVSAKNNTLGYRTSRFFNRNRRLIGGTAAILAAFLALSVLYVFQINKEKNLAEDEAEKALQIKNLMIDIFSANDPRTERFAGIDLTVRDAMSEGIERVNEELRDRPDIYIEMMSAMGVTLKNIEDYEGAWLAFNYAKEMARDGFGDSSREYALQLSYMGNLMIRSDSLEMARNFLSQALELEIASEKGSDFELAHRYSRYAYAHARSSNYSRAFELYSTADSLYIGSGYGETIPRYNNLSNLADVKMYLNDYEGAEDDFKRALEFYEERYDGLHSSIVTTIGKLGNLYYRTSQNRLAEEYLLRALEMRKQFYGEESRYVASQHSLLSINYRVLDELEKARFHSEREVEIYKKLTGDRSLTISTAYNNLALVQKDMGELGAAEKSMRMAVEIMEEHFNPTNPRLAIAYYNLADLYYLHGNLERALELFEQVVEIDKLNYGDTHPEIAVDLNRLASVQRDMGDFEIAMANYLEAEEIFRTEYPENHFRIGQFYIELGTLHQMMGDLDRALNHYKRAEEVFLHNFDEDHSSVVESREKIESLSDKI